MPHPPSGPTVRRSDPLLPLAFKVRGALVGWRLKTRRRRSCFDFLKLFRAPAFLAPRIKRNISSFFYKILELFALVFLFRGELFFSPLRPPVVFYFYQRRRWRRKQFVPSTSRAAVAAPLGRPKTTAPDYRTPVSLLYPQSFNP